MESCRQLWKAMEDFRRLWKVIESYEILLKVIECCGKLYPDTYIEPLFHTTFKLAIYPAEWKDSITQVPQQPGKANYMAPGAYRPITLLDTIGKVLSSCVAKNIMKMAEKHRLPPDNHFGCRPGHTTMDALHYVIGTAKDAWWRGNVLGAFPSIILDQLIHNMWRRGISQKYTESI